MTARNLLIPFRRDRKRDLATGEGDALLASKVRQVLLTEGATPRSSGELPWRTNFGSGLGLLRHHANDAVTRELIRVRVQEAIERWLPGVEVVETIVLSDSSQMAVRLTVRGGGVPRTLTVP